MALELKHTSLVNAEVSKILDQGVVEEGDLSYNKRYTANQISDMLDACDLDEKTKSRMRGFFGGALQFVFNMITIEDFEHKPAALLTNTPDDWERGYNAMVEIFQLEHDCIQEEDFETING